MERVKNLDVDSKTVKVLKLVHQGVVLCALARLRTEIPLLPMTKDVRTADGWRIKIRFDDAGFIQVSHVRREQSIDAFGDKSHSFDFCWELCCTLDEHVNELTAAHLRIVKRGFGKHARDSFKHRIAGQLIEDLRVA